MPEPAFEVARVARLARLELSPEESEALARDASRVLAAFAELPAKPADAKDARDAAARSSAQLREDAVVAADPNVRDAILAQVPRRDGDLVRAPRGL